jgi:hypothetical protein
MMTEVQVVVGLAITLGVIVVVCGLLFVLDWLLDRSPLLDQPCRIHVDQWGMFCATHTQRLRSFGSCEGRR